MPENELRFESAIELINVTHYYVGWFYCVVNSTQLAKDDYTENKIGKTCTKIDDVNGPLKVIGEFYFQCTAINAKLV